MKKIVLTALATGALLVPVAPAMAGQADNGNEGGNGNGPKTSKAKAYGKFCQDQSKTKAEGQKRTDFSLCVTALAKAKHSDETGAREACRALSKKHVKGEKGTAFSRCVVGVAQMRKAEKRQDKQRKAKANQKARAYGKFCQDQSKKHVAGQKGTPFSQCVNALAKADRNERVTARKACRALSKKHVAGEKGTPFSRCVVGVAQMRKAD